MYYEINVSLHGMHFFATAERSCTDERHAAEVYIALRKAFPMAEGYSISVKRRQNIGTSVDLENWEELHVLRLKHIAAAVLREQERGAA